MNVKDLMTNEELSNLITEDITDLKQDTKVTYEVWAIGYNSDNTVADSETLLKDFVNPDEAVAYAESLSVSDILKATNLTDDMKVSIEIETVVDDIDLDGTMNIGTVYKRDLCLDSDYEDETSIDTIRLSTSEYTLLEDEGLLKVSCKLMPGFNKNDCVQIYFIDEDSSPLTYRIISKVIYEDGDYYHCEFLY